MHLLLSQGMPITSALELAQDVVLSNNVAKLIKHSRDMVLSGQPFAEGLKMKKGVIPKIMIKLIEVGEKSGTLAKSLLDISEHLDYEVNKNLKTLSVVLEPVMLVIVGIAVGGMMLAVIGPIYGLISQVGSR